MGKEFSDKMFQLEIQVRLTEHSGLLFSMMYIALVTYSQWWSVTFTKVLAKSSGGRGDHENFGILSVYIVLQFL
jgi:hypothetical protein